MRRPPRAYFVCVSTMKGDEMGTGGEGYGRNDERGTYESTDSDAGCDAGHGARADVACYAAAGG